MEAMGKVSAAMAHRRWWRAAEQHRVVLRILRSWQGERWEAREAVALRIRQTKAGGGPI